MVTAASGVSSQGLPSMWERDPPFADPRIRGQTENLKPTTVGKDGSIPTHEPMQSARGGKSLQTRTQHEMVGIGQDDLRTSAAHFFWK
jgi:hypothetical protein